MIPMTMPALRMLNVGRPGMIVLSSGVTVSSAK